MRSLYRLAKGILFAYAGAISIVAAGITLYLLAEAVRAGRPIDPRDVAIGFVTTNAACLYIYASALWVAGPLAVFVGRHVPLDRAATAIVFALVGFAAHAAVHLRDPYLTQEGFVSTIPLSLLAGAVFGIIFWERFARTYLERAIHRESLRGSSADERHFRSRIARY